MFITLTPGTAGKRAANPSLIAIDLRFANGLIARRRTKFANKGTMMIIQRRTKMMLLNEKKWTVEIGTYWT